LHLAEGQLVFYREKVKKTQKLELDKDTLLAAMRYMEVCRPTKQLLLGSLKDRHGQKMAEGFGRRSIQKRVEYICQRFGLEDVSPHGLRHKWVDLMIEGGTDMKTLEEAGGWNSVAMPMHYASKHEIANAGAKLKAIPYIPYHKQLQQSGQ
jgi:integrase